MIIQNEAGEDVEVFTQDDLNRSVSAELAKAMDDYKVSNPDMSVELEDLKIKLAGAENDLAEASTGNPQQVERLRKERDEAKTTLRSSLETINKRLDDVQNQGTTTLKNSLLDQVSNGDKKVRDRIEFEFDRYNSGAKSDKDIHDRMAIAASIVVGSKSTPNVMSGGFGGSMRGNSNFNSGSTATTFNDSEKAIGSQMGITEADREAYLKAKAK